MQTGPLNLPGDGLTKPIESGKAVSKAKSYNLCLTGGVMSVVLDLSFSLCIWISAAFAIIYTLLGGLYSVAYTDVIQLSLIFVSLVSLFRVCLCPGQENF